MTKTTLNTTWQQIGLANQSGNVWVPSEQPYIGAKEQADAVVWWGTSAPTGDQKLDEAVRVFPRKANSDFLYIELGATEILYARCRSENSECVLMSNLS